jgi:TPR repeat protein
MTWLDKAAQRGHADAQNGYGMLLAMVQHDPADAFEWLNRAANQGNMYAENNLGVFYLNGTGVAKDSQKAAQYLLMAARQGHVGAQNTVATMYLNGTGVQTNRVEAYKWLKLAVARGDPEAKKDLNLCSAALTPAQIVAADNQVAAMENRFRAASLPDPPPPADSNNQFLAP